MSDERFRDTADFLPTWNCKYTGSTKGGDLEKLEATPESWIIGWYIGTRDGEINGDPVKIHTVRVVEVGNPAHLSEPIDDAVKGKDYEFIGDFVINDRLATKIQPGQACKIQWMGLTQPKKQGGRPYHNWKLFEDTHTEPITVKDGVVVEDLGSSVSEMVAEEAIPEGAPSVPAGPGSEPQAAQANPPTAAAQPEEDDDLPF